MRFYICPENDCTMCMACANACPKDAIYVSTNEYGYEKICINQDLCIDCGICERICENRNNIEKNKPHTGYAAQARDKEKLEKSASGGAFQMLAEYVLDQNGVCYGCNSSFGENGYGAKHIRVDTMDRLYLILNSKYVPSIIGDTYKMAENDLKNEKLVLYSGTPCQIQGLKSYLKKDYDNLLTVDLICHGVTSTKLFNDYLSIEENNNNIKITDYMFRDKSVSWGTNFCYEYYKKSDKNKKLRIKHLPREGSSYMINYLRGNIFRENCYTCNLSCDLRVSDITIGDYWGIEVENPELATQKADPIIIRKGVSCILLNTKKAERFIEAINKKMIIYKVDINSIISNNGNLQRASVRGNGRDVFLENYKKFGYKKIEDDYNVSVKKKMWIYNFKNILKSHLPDRIRIIIYNNPTLRKIVFHS